MSVICQICGKKKAYGNSQKHRRGVAGKRWLKRTTVTPREFLPNLQKVTVLINGIKKNMKLCTKCIKRIKKFKSIKDYKRIELV